MEAVCIYISDKFQALNSIDAKACLVSIFELLVSPVHRVSHYKDLWHDLFGDN